MKKFSYENGVVTIDTKNSPCDGENTYVFFVPETITFDNERGLATFYDGECGAYVVSAKDSGFNTFAEFKVDTLAKYISSSSPSNSPFASVDLDTEYDSDEDAGIGGVQINEYYVAGEFHVDGTKARWGSLIRRNN